MFPPDPLRQQPMLQRPPGRHRPSAAEVDVVDDPGGVVRYNVGGVHPLDRLIASAVLELDEDDIPTPGAGRLHVEGGRPLRQGAEEVVVRERRLLRRGQECGVDLRGSGRVEPRLESVAEERGDSPVGPGIGWPEDRMGQELGVESFDYRAGGHTGGGAAGGETKYE